MLRAIVEYFRTGPDRPLRDASPAEIRSSYERHRWSVFLSVTFGYGMFYLCRVNFSVVKKLLLDEGVLSATEMGTIGSVMLVVYAVGKLVNGALADHCNIRKFMSAGLFFLALANLAMGTTTYFWLFVAFWGINGWFQATGSAPSVVALSQWFSGKERGTRYGLWSVAHSIGEGLTFIGTAYLVSKTGWEMGFIGPAIVCLLAALVLFRTLADRPRALGLPHVAEYKGEPVPPAPESTSRSQLAALKSPAIWVLGLASAAMYVARYGINNWGMLYLQEAKGYELTEAGTIIAVNTVAGLLGAAGSGFLSDSLFGSRRNPPALIFGILEVGALCAFFLIPPDHMLLDCLAMAVFGLALGGLLVYLGGLMAIDIAPPKAAGAAMGLVGLFSYLGAAVQDGITGALIDQDLVIIEGVRTYDFHRVSLFWIGASVVSILLTLSIWRVRPSTAAGE